MLNSTPTDFPTGKLEVNGIPIVPIAGGGVAIVTGVLPIVSSGGTTPEISINPATTSNPGSLSAADKVKLDATSGTNTGDQVVPATSSATTSFFLNSYNAATGVFTQAQPAFSGLTGIPTTIAGYGITDFNTLGDARWSQLAHTHAFADLTARPSTIAGYGITDFNSLGDARWSLLAHTHTFASLTSKPTTVAGYGITDAITTETDPLALKLASNLGDLTDLDAARANLALRPGFDIQVWSDELDALAAFSSTGLAVRTGDGAWAQRILTPGSGKISVTNGNGVSGNPTIDLGTVNFTDLAGSLALGQVPNDLITYAKLQNVSATSRLLGRKTAGAGDPEELTLSEVLDFISSAAHGDILYRGAATWTRLPAGTEGDVLTTHGAAAPTWETPSGGGASYLVYTALLTQAGNNAPVATVLQNTLGGTVVFSYDAEGLYSATLAAAFTANKTAIACGNPRNSSGTDRLFDFTATYVDANSILLETKSMNIPASSCILADDVLVETLLEIRVYP